jgi:hypothetical protein
MMTARSLLAEKRYFFFSISSGFTDVNKAPMPDHKIMLQRSQRFWHTHKAKKLLAEDVKSGKAYKMKPKELWSTKKEYKDFPLDVFRNHIHQEKRFQREGPYWQLKRNKKGLRRHEAHVKELKRGWLGLHNKDKLLVDMMKDLHIN